MANQNDDNNDIGEVLENFRTAVDNGQLRLAMIHLVDIIDAIVDVLTEEQEEAQDRAKNETVSQEEKPLNIKPEKKTAPPASEKIEKEKVSE